MGHLRFHNILGNHWCPKKQRCQSLNLRLAKPWDHFRSIPYVGKPPHAKYCGFWCDLRQRHQQFPQQQSQRQLQQQPQQQQP